MGYTVWASHTSVLPVCDDAALRDKAWVRSKLKYPGGEHYGQAGWEFGLKFSGLSDLATQLEAGLSVPASYCGNWWENCPIAFKGGMIDRLAINAHGIEGELQINGPGSPGITADNFATYKSQLDRITPLLARNATVLLMGCLAGKGEAGTNLLVKLSRVWFVRRVVGFTTIGYRAPGPMKLAGGDGCVMPGMRDTDEQSAWNEAAMDRYFKADWHNLSKLPWASEKSPHAKVAECLFISKWPAGETGPKLEGTYVDYPREVSDAFP